MNRSLFNILLLSFLLASCAKDKSDQKATARPSDVAATEDEMIVKTPPDGPLAKPGEPDHGPLTNEHENKIFLEAQKIARNIQITCRNNECNPSVGLLSAVIKIESINIKTDKIQIGWTSGQCSASLMSADILVTNGHCIPRDLHKAGSDCRGRLFITFPDEAGHKEYDRQIGCSRVLLRHKDPNFDGSDYAYIKLERATNRPPLRMSREGFEHGKTYHLNKVNPLRGVVDSSGNKMIAGEFEREACQALHDTAVFDQPLNKQSYSQLLVDCKVIPGNSGSPVLADDGTLRGVAYAFLRKDLLVGLYGQNGSKLPEESELADLNLVSNFACLKDPEDVEGRALPAACAGYADRLRAAKAQAEAQKLEKLKPGARKLIKENQGKHAFIPAFNWTLRTSQSPQTGTIGVGLPECVNPAPAKSLLGKRTKFLRPLFYVQAEYDRYIHASNYKVTWGGFSDSEERLEVNRGPNASYQVSIVDPNNGQSDLNGPMAECR